MWVKYNDDGRVEGDDVTRTAYVYDAEGASLGSRPYNLEENQIADAVAAKDAEIAQREATRVLVRAIITELQAEKDRAQVVIDKANVDITGADTKDVARAAKRIADAAIDLARFVENL